MSGPLRIVDAAGVHPKALDQSVLEQKLYAAGRFRQADPSMIFVFGSNEGGHHGAGAARYALLHRGAKMGVSFGPSGMSFAIPTKDASIRYTLDLREIRAYVNGFMGYAQEMTHQTYQVTCIGCGLAGLKHQDIAPMFYFAPKNCLFDTLWEPYLSQRARFWGTF